MAPKRKTANRPPGRVQKALRQAASTYVIQGSVADGLESNPSDSVHDVKILPGNQASVMSTSEDREVCVKQDHVYRVRGLPREISNKQIIDLVSSHCKVEDCNSLRIRSLAPAHDGHSTVATLSFSQIPAALSGYDENEWSFDITDFVYNLQPESEADGRISRQYTLSIDDHFHGLTVLRSPEPLCHQVDCIALPSLGGHAFDSFKAKGSSSYMWLCDDLPFKLTTTRIILYGYESQLHMSWNFQDLEALATTLRQSIRNLSQKKERKPLFFIAHSLGGLIVKEAIIQMQEALDEDRDVLSSVYGALFFGVPNQGMDIKSLIPMVEGQVNQTLLHSISNESQLLRNQSRNFEKAFDFADSQIVCFYETVMSPTAIKIADQWAMKGPPCILVDLRSATHGRRWENQAHHIQAIERDHSQLVKFKANDEVYERVLITIKEFSEKALAMKRNRNVEVGKLTPDDIDCLAALAFPEMRYRQDEVQDARADSCSWILEHTAYKSWVDDPHGLLWVKGKPGSGKSTLMKRIYKEATPADVRLTFFFHRRGVQLQQTAIGMLRTLSHQLISQSGSVRAIFQKYYNEKRIFGIRGRDWDWHDAELRQVLKSALAVATQSHHISIFLDALDEAMDDSAESIVTYIYEVHEMLQNSAGRTNICFSSRQYPIYSRNMGTEICMEKENGSDISDYINVELAKCLQENSRQSWLDDLETLQSQVTSTADGVFLWARLIIPLIAKQYNKGKSLNQVQQMLHELLPDLSSIYEHTLKNLIDDEDQADSLHLMQWVCLATRPLSLTELRYALALDDSAFQESQNSVSDSQGFVEDDLRMKQLITSLSGGLIEVRDHYYHQGFVQFIHQSVNDTLLKGGFKWLGLESEADVVGKGHQRLTKSCINYLKLEEVQELRFSGLDRDQIAMQAHPFLDYAIKSWSLHAQMAEQKGISQIHLIQKFEWPGERYFKRWIDIYQAIDKDNERCPQPSTTFLHTSAALSLSSVIEELLDRGQDLEVQDIHGNRALHFAARFGHTDIVKMLLNVGVELQAQNLHGNTALERAASGGHTNTMEVLLNNGADVNCSTGKSGNALYSAASAGSYLATVMLLQKGAKVNAQGGEYGNALQAAAYSRSEPVVKLLLDREADIHAQGGGYGDALQAAAAAYTGRKLVVKLLLDRGADIHAQGGRFGNALQAAACSGSEPVVKLLLDRGADIHVRGGEYGNALQAAAAGLVDCKPVVKLLLGRGADIHAQRGQHGHALQAVAAAVSEGSKTLVKLLLDRGADIHAQGGKYGNALQAAAFSGSEPVVMLLLDRGARVICQDHQGRYPLQLAIRGNHDNLVDLVIARLELVDWTAQDKQGCSALHFAASAGSARMVQRILESNIDVNIADTHGWTALHWACRNGDHDTVEILRYSDADSTRRDINGWTPLDVAIFCGNGSLVSIFQDKSVQAQAQNLVSCPGKLHEDYSCSSCYHDIYGSRHNCKECEFYKLCFRCIIDAPQIHDNGHSFLEAVES
ncbi:hypothetical protein BP5796_00543 [Coleophoma crateriformis]|uniref:DUF676 domain-containing protein n=1 Tax=Coleophoma crateriformis TaxID=565419 RepID=A0A3D8T8A6_9HELO|nr:hypothetical protein BP5796_00543 [Coleophoma crateriformis]